ncbi:MAG: xanthine dehydrogenase accessory protein XdhC [Planctomycetota bacterium]
MNQQEWLEVLAGLRDERRPCAQVVVTGVRGSAPREVGARMIVSDGRLVWGTIGGGRLEHLAIERAAEMAREGVSASVTEVFPLSEKAGQCCGGEVTLYFEAFGWSRRRLVVFGAGHVAQAVGGLAPYMGLDVLLVDPRAEDEVEPPLPAERPYEVLFVDAPEEEIDQVPADSLVLVMTHSHALDQEIIARALRRGTFPYVGLIGSERKWKRFAQRLTQRGFSEEELGRVTCPIGVSKGSKEPRKIALSVAAEIVDVVARAGDAAPR